MSKIFISGVAGFLGSHLADSLLNEGHEVVGCDNLIGGERENVPEKIEFYETDCDNLEKMKEALQGVDIVYHCACTAYEGLSVFSPSLVCQNTYQNTISLISASIQNKVKRFVFCSSMARYGNKEKLPFTEDMDPEPEDPYGISKLSAEKTLKNLAETHGMEYVIAVPHNIIGPRQKYDDPYRNVASIMINLMLQGKQPIIYGDGEQKRCFSFVQDNVDCLLKMGFQENVVGEVINIGPDEEFVSVNQLAKTISEILDFDLDPVYVADRPREVRKATCSADKARKLLGYETQYTLKEGLKEMAEEIKRKGPKKFKYHLPLEIVSDKTPETWKNKMF